MTLSCLTKDHAAPEGKLRVYCAYHPDDFAYVGRIAEILWEVWDCAVYYHNYVVNGEPDRRQLACLLDGMQLIVVPLTSGLLNWPNTARDFEIAYARKRQIPILHLPRKSKLAAAFQAAFGEPERAETEWDAGISALYREAGAPPSEDVLDVSVKAALEQKKDAPIAENVREGDRRFLLSQFRNAAELYARTIARLYMLRLQDETRYAEEFRGVVLRAVELDRHFELLG